MSEKVVGMEYWFDVANLLPIVAMMFPNIQFMVYDMLLCTTTCCSSCSKDSHTWDVVRYVKIPPISCVCLLYDGKNHFDAMFLKRNNLSYDLY